MEQMNTVHELEAEFGKTFMQHVERLAGRALPALDFPIDVATLACFVLLGERETQLKSNESTRRFTYEDLSREISDLGVPMNGNMKEVIRGMEKSGYVRVQKDSFLVSETPLLKSCHILDEIFPRMPGLNLVAYLIQTMEEVLSGRKKLGDAHLQLDQVLEMHGVPLSGSQDTNYAKEVPPPSSKSNISTQKDEGSKSKKTLEKKSRQTMLKLLQAAAREESQKRSSTSKVIRSGSTMVAGSHEKRLERFDDSSFEKSFQEGSPIHIPPEKLNDREAPEVKREGLEEPDQGHLETKPSEHGETYPPSDQLSEKPFQELPTVPEVSENDSGPEETRTKPFDELQTKQSKKTEGEEEESDDQDSLVSDDEKAQNTFLEGGEQEDILHDKEIEERISAFEEELAMTCPLCAKGRVEIRETSKGKQFYECSQDGCYFVSWGKPYHLTCPKCRNNFLIEAVGAEGKTFLKCPRATCNYSQNLPGEDESFEETQKKVGEVKDTTDEELVRRPRKKVVRRRLVRRKK